MGNEKAVTIKAVAWPDGENQGLKYEASYVTTTTLPATALGLAVASALNKACSAGADPAMPPFTIIVTFS